MLDPDMPLDAQDLSRDLTDRPEAELIQLACAGQDQAFVQLIDRHRAMVCATVKRYLGEDEDAHDAVQETFIAAYRHLADLTEPNRFGAWLNAIAANKARQWLSKRYLHRRYYTHPATMAEVQTAQHLQDENETISAMALRAAMNLLSPPDRAVTTLFYLLGMPQAAIAKSLNIPVGTVKSRLERARRQLRRRLSMRSKRQETGVSGEDYGRAVIEGMRGVIHWQKLLPDDDIEGWRRLGHGTWERSGDVVMGQSTDNTGGVLAIGDASWRDYEVSVLMTVIEGANGQIVLRLCDDDQAFYFFDMMFGWQAAAISRGRINGDGRAQKLSVVNYPLEHGREYDVMVAARGASLTTYIDGRLVNQLTDTSLSTGGIALAVWHSKTAFRDVRIRHMS
ncbi:MAG: sigma-70 family RNA polymerase sigma factor [Phycisphaeraceae bacterium]|nr:sigma-70 family RNA polymerase sigma factor [Phycisphaeraceae bacterium]